MIFNILHKQFRLLWITFLSICVFACKKQNPKNLTQNAGATEQIILTSKNIVPAIYPTLNFNARKNIQLYTSEQGLSSSDITDVKEDKDGNLWFASRKGLNKFNGLSYTHYLKEFEIWGIEFDKNNHLWIAVYNHGIIKYDGNQFIQYTQEHGLHDMTYRKIFCDSKGIVWLGGNNNGIDYFDGESFKHIDLKQEKTGNGVQDIFEDKEGNIWFATFGGGIFKYNQHGLTNYKVPIESIPIKEQKTMIDFNLHVNKFHSITQDKYGDIWAGSRFLGLFKIVSDTLHRISDTLLNTPNLTTIRDMKLDRLGNMVISSNLGLILIKNKKTEIISVSEGLITKSINRLFFDSGENLWITSSTGVSKFNEGSFQYIPFHQNNNGMNSAVKFIEQIDGSCYISTGNKTLKFNKSLNNTDSVFNRLFAFSDKTHTSICHDSTNIWITTFGNGFFQIKKNNYSIQRFAYFGPNKSNSYFTSSLNDHLGNIWFGGLEGLVQFSNNSFKHYGLDNGLADFEILCLGIDFENRLWIGSETGISIFNNNQFTHLDFLDKKGITSIKKGLNQGEMIIGTRFLGFYIYNYINNTFKHYSEKNGLSSNAIQSIGIDSNKNIWIATDYGLNILRAKNYTISQDSSLNVFENFTPQEGFISATCMHQALYISKEKVYIGTQKNLTMYNLYNIFSNKRTKPTINITGLKLFFKEVNWDEQKDEYQLTYSKILPWYSLPEKLVLPYSQNHVTFTFVGIDWAFPNNMSYEFMLEGVDKDWGIVSGKNEITYSNLSPGKYRFKVIAVNTHRGRSNQAIFWFEITPPFWKTYWFYTLTLLALTGMIIGYIKMREKILKDRQKILENEVHKRTLELNEEKEVVQKQNKNIRESIEYAKKIQEAILPDQGFIKNLLPESFVLYLPKDIVSGDFYWVQSIHNKILLSVVDCTGHGVPGAFMSIIGSSMLDKIVKEYDIDDPGTILNTLNKELIEFLKQNSPEADVKDGMNLALCSLDVNNLELIFCGSYNPLYIIRNHEIIVLKGDNIPIGKSKMHEHKVFESQTIKLNLGDVIYLFSDGFVDQKGGTEHKKFYYSRFKELLLQIYTLPMHEQEQVLYNTIHTWKGDMEQMDDICIIGFKV